jgi:hypothetical protein
MSTKRILYVAAALVLAAVSAAPTLAATPGERTVTINLTSDVVNGDQTFVGSGPGICSSGTANDEVIEYIEFGETFKIRLTKWLHCDDGSGDLQILLSAGRPTDVPQALSGGWVVINGSGGYATAVGGGMMTGKIRYPADDNVHDTMTGTITK